MPKCLTLSALLWVLPMAAQPAEDTFPGENLIGVQGRASLPAADLSSAVGSPGLGAGFSVQAELHFPPHLLDRSQSMMAARVALGADDWSAVGRGANRTVSAYAFGLDGVFFLKDDGRAFLNGPYLIAGAELIAWNVGTAASGTGSSERAVRAGITAGFGCRLDRHLDAELKVMGSEVNPALKVGAAMACLNYWF